MLQKKLKLSSFLPKFLLCCPNTSTHAFPAMPIATPAPKDDSPQHKSLAKCLYPEYGEYFNLELL